MMDVAGTHAGDVFAVTIDGAVSRFNGIDWECLPQVPGRANAIWGSEEGSVFVVGRDLSYDSDQAAAWRFDGDGWTVVARGGGYYMFGVFGFGPEDVYFTGQDGVLYHYDGVETVEIASAPRALSCVWGSSPDDIFVGAGGYGHGAIYHFDGSSLQEMATFENGVTAVSGCSGTDVYATTAYEADYLHGGVHHYDGTGWHAEWSTSGGSCLDVMCTRGQVYAVCLNDLRRFDGEEWSDFDTGFLGPAGLGVVWADDRSGVFLAGWSGGGMVQEIPPYMVRYQD